MSNNIYALRNEYLSVAVASHGAELQSIHDLKLDLELLWQGDEKFWLRRAPVLFPIVGRLANDTLVYKNQHYAMTQHGFARDCEFELLFQTDTQLEFRLNANETTRSKYPFEFELIIAYRLIENQLRINYIVRNLNENELPFSIGGHPAFNWPLVSGVYKEDHVVEFECNELSQVRMLKNGLLMPEKFPSPVKDKHIQLQDRLFEKDALIFDGLKNRKVSYKAGDFYTVEMKFDDFPQFGLWTKPDAPFICLEPWYGYASPKGFEGDIRTKPGILLLPEHGEAQLAYSVEFKPGTK